MVVTQAIDRTLISATFSKKECVPSLFVLRICIVPKCRARP